MPLVSNRMLSICLRGGLWLTGFASAASVAQAQIPCGYEVAHVIQAPYCAPFGFPSTAGVAISPNGRYVCGFYPQCVVGTNNRPFYYDTVTEEFVTIPLGPGFTSASPRSVNDAGIICGNGIKSGAGDRGFVYDLNTGRWTELPSQNGASGYSFAYAINAKNEVVGHRTVDDGGRPTQPMNAYRWSAEAGFYELGLVGGFGTFAVDINDHGVVAGTMGPNGYSVPYIWEASKYVALDGIAQIENVAWALNNKNQVVGQSLIPNPGGSGFITHGFLADLGGAVDLGVLAGFERSAAYGINDDSTIVGFCRKPLPPFPLDRGFVWANGTMHDLNDLVDLEGNNLVISANAIAPDGTIVCGAAPGSSGSHCVVLVPLKPQIGDIVSNCRVDVDDLLAVINEWGRKNSAADLNEDGSVDALDLAIVLDHWS